MIDRTAQMGSVGYDGAPSMLIGELDGFDYYVPDAPAREEFRMKPGKIEVTVADGVRLEPYKTTALSKFIDGLAAHLKAIPKDCRDSARISFELGDYDSYEPPSYTITYKRLETECEVKARVAAAKKAQKAYEAAKKREAERERETYLKLKTKYEGAA